MAQRSYIFEKFLINLKIDVLLVTEPYWTSQMLIWFYPASNDKNWRKKHDTQLKLLVYFARLGAEQDQQEDRQSHTEISDNEGEAPGY